MYSAIVEIRVRPHESPHGKKWSSMKLCSNENRYIRMHIFGLLFQRFCTLNTTKIYRYESFLIYCNAKRENLKRNFNRVNKIVFQMTLKKETALNKVSHNSGLICLTTILKINRTFGRGELFLLTWYKQKLYLVFLI